MLPIVMCCLSQYGRSLEKATGLVEKIPSHHMMASRAGSTGGALLTHAIKCTGLASGVPRGNDCLDIIRQ